MLKILSTNLKLLIQSPKDYLYSFVYIFNNKTIEIKKFNPKDLIIAKNLMKEIKTACPEITLYLIGSLPLKIEGRGDIDLYASVPRNRFGKVCECLSGLFTNPIKKRSSHIVWDFNYRGVKTELKLTSPGDKVLQRQLFQFYLLKNNSNYLNEYRRLKIELNGHPKLEYMRKRMEFFNRIIAEN